MSNTIHMQCRLGKDPELKDVGEHKVCELWVAESEKFTKKGERVKETNWWSVQFWNRSGEVIAEHFKKGDGIIITGNLKQEDGNDGRKFYKVRGQRFEFPMGKKGDAGEPPAAKASGVADTPGSDDIQF